MAAGVVRFWCTFGCDTEFEIDAATAQRARLSFKLEGTRKLLYLNDNPLFVFCCQEDLQKIGKTDSKGRIYRKTKTGDYEAFAMVNQEWLRTLKMRPVGLLRLQNQVARARNR